ncbi:MAG: HDOD domain-containing protein [Pseudomonadota bacterium]
MKTVIFVDDEVSILEGLRRNLRRMRREWDMHFFAEPVEALSFLQANPVDVIVSDMRMPGMNGAELLQAVQASRPETLRLALSGYADSELILESVHAIHRYIAKPADIDTICAAVTRSITLQEQLSQPSLHAYVGALGALPSLPHIYDQLMQLISSDDFALEDVAALIEADVGLSATVLKIVNSAFFGNFGTIESLKQAVSVLGSDTIKNIVLTEKLVKQFDKADTDELERINGLSKSVSALSHRFARSAKLSKRDADHTQLAGMVSGLGDMILLDRGVLEGSDVQIEPPLIAAYLLSLWAMADPIVEAVAGHRVAVDPAAEPNPSGVSTADCVRAAWLALDANPTGEGVDLDEVSAQLRPAFTQLAQDAALADTWIEAIETVA